jgi:SsrA-binding protein
MAGNQVNIKNKRAHFEYSIDETFTAGMVLKGTEIKSIRNGKASILESYCVVDKGEVFIRNMHVTPYVNASFFNHSARSDRKLLLTSREIKKLEKWVKTKGNTIIALKLFLSEKGWLKIEIGTAVGKKLHDKREDLKQKDDKRDMARAMKR